MHAARARVSHGGHSFPRQFTLNAEAIDIHVRIVQIKLNRADRISERARERRSRKRRPARRSGGEPDCDARRRRRICNCDDKVLLVVSVEVEAVSRAQTGIAVTEQIPRKPDARRQIQSCRILVEWTNSRTRIRERWQSGIAAVDVHRQRRCFITQSGIYRHSRVDLKSVLKVAREKGKAPIAIESATWRESKKALWIVG